MKRLILKPIVGALCVCSLLNSFPMISYADNGVRTGVVGREVDESVLLDSSAQNSRSTQAERSAVLANALAEISNKGNSIAGGYAETLCYKDTEWMCLTLYLERYDEEDNEWYNVETYYQEYEPDEEGNLHMVTYSFEKEVEPGYYYRVRCRHEIEYLDEDGDLWYEAKVTRTDGIMITSEPA